MTEREKLIELTLKYVVGALEKQIPKKVTHEATLLICCTCPNCKHIIDRFNEFMGKRFRITYNYCNYCGQALDWSEYEK